MVTREHKSCKSKVFLVITVLSLLSFVHISLIANAEQTMQKSSRLKTKNFGIISRKINSLIEDRDVGVKNLLVVLDDDNTILTTNDNNPFGGVAWWQWQSALLSHKKNKNLEANNQDALIAIQTLLFELRWMVPTDVNLPKTLQSLQDKGVSVIVLTARGYDMADVTEAQFDHIVNGKYIMSLDFSKTAVPPIDGYSEPFVCPKLERKVYYKSGIMYLSGQDKGLALECLLDKAEKHYSHIVFVDDNDGNENLADPNTNTNRVFKVFSKKPNTTIFTYDYTLEDSELKLTEKEKREMKLKWEKLRSAINDIFGNYSILYPISTTIK